MTSSGRSGRWTSSPRTSKQGRRRDAGNRLTVLCYGDSNTYGMIDKRRPADRFGETQRWPKVMQRHLGPSWLVIEEGLNGRTTDRDDPLFGELRNGRKSFRSCLEKHAPIDVLILMLGTNDLKACYGKSPREIGTSIAVLIADARMLAAERAEASPAILVVSPPTIRPKIEEYAVAFEGGHQKSLQLPTVLEDVAGRHEAEFFDANSLVEGDSADGVHMSDPTHRALGLALCGVVEGLFVA